MKSKAEPRLTKAPTRIARRSWNEELVSLIEALHGIRKECLALEDELARELAPIPEDFQPSARNLVHYLALRHRDLRELQHRLHRLGLSSLGRLEAHTLAGLDAVLRALQKLRTGKRKLPSLDHAAAISFDEGPQLLRQHAEALLGPTSGQTARIMVTMPSEAAHRYDLVRDLVGAGMSVMRINCAHDDAHAWNQMAAHLRRAIREVGRPCRTLVDLGGPKLRTGRIEGGGRVSRWKPRRDVRGHVIAPARVLVQGLSRTERPAAHFDAVLPVESGFTGAAAKNDILRIEDCRGRSRDLLVQGTGSDYFWVDSQQSCYVERGATVQLIRAGERIAESTVDEVQHVEQPLLLRTGDILIVTDDSEGGRPARFVNGQAIEATRIPCTLAEAFRDVRAGQRIAFDDGAIWGMVRNATEKHLEVEITHATPCGSKLGSDKGINLPDTELQLSPLTAKDRKDLEFAVKQADMVGLSFVHRPQDVLQLQEKLRELGGSHLGILLKIETRAGFEQLPRILLAALRCPPIGVMVARGDLAVEMGFERMAEVQEEILWLCEAAHVPVIWATQVLEGLTKKGTPSRAELTDAAMSTRAECVMLNKGPYVVDAVRFLADVQHRMMLHQEKKNAMLRKLSVSELAPLSKEKEFQVKAG
ncbi:MAG TPA: pyruvate kinase [Candidatus Acidoferrum sp.]|nr:pyruvate kinase [Candidatus Acidoferrum sp.]